MSMPKDIGIVDTMIGFPADDFAMYDFIREQLKDPSAKFEFPVEYMFKQVPKELYGSSKDPVTLTLNEMDKHGVEIGLIGVGGEVSRKALTEHPDRFVGQGSVDPNTGMEGIREMVRQYEAFGVSSFGAFNAGLILRWALMTLRCIRFMPSVLSWMYPSFPVSGFRDRGFQCGRKKSN